MDQRPLELILARNFLTSLSTPAFLVDEGGGIIFYNEAAGGLLGISFEEFGQKPADEWSGAIGPFGDDGEPMPIEELPTTRRCAQAGPAHGSFVIHSHQRRRARDRVDRAADRRRDGPGGRNDLLLGHQRKVGYEVTRMEVRRG